MFLPPRRQILRPQNLNPGGTVLLGSTALPVDIETSQPLEEVMVVVNATVNAAISGAVATNPDFMLGILKRFRLVLQDQGKPRAIVDFSGVGLLEYASRVGLNLGRSTLASIRQSQANAFAASLQFRICYRIPLVHPMLGESLRTRMLLPVHLLTEAPQILLDFETAANLFTTGSFTSVSADIVLLKRDITPAQSDEIIADGGFLTYDLMENVSAVPVGYAGPEYKFPIAQAGSYLGVMLRTYRGGASVTRDVIDKTTTFGSEQRWRIERGGNVLTEFCMHHQQEINDWSGVSNCLTANSAAATGTFAAPTSAGSPTVRFDLPNFGGYVAANTLFQPASSVLLDFLSDGLGAEGANEFGSVLNCNVVPGQKVELIGEVANVATNSSLIYMGGHRIYGDLSRWQALKPK